MNQDKIDHKPKKSLANTFSLVAIVTVLSKIAGLLRDIVLLQAFGTSMISDAFNYATLFTGNFFILFGGLGGPFHTSTVAILTPLKDKKEFTTTTFQIIFYTLIILLFLAIIGYFISPYIVHIIAPANGHGQIYQVKLWQETTLDLRIMLPLIIIAGLIGIAYGIMNVYDKFFLPSISPSISSIVLIISVLITSKEIGGLSLAYGTLVGALFQLLSQFSLITQLHFTFSLKPTNDTVNFFQMLWPAAIGTSIGQLNIYVDSFFTSQLQEGSWTAIVNANRLVQLPLGVLLTAMLVPILPRFTTYVFENKIEVLKAEFHKALRILWFLAIPLGTLLFALKDPVVEILFKRGAFDQDSKLLLINALTFLIPSIFFYVARDLITRVFYAHKDTKTPYYVALFAIFTNFIFDFILIKPLGIGGITLSTTIVTIINLVILNALIKQKIGSLELTKTLKPLITMLLAACLSSVTAYLIMHNCTSFSSHSFILKIICLSFSGGLGCLMYFILCLFFKLNEASYGLKFIQDKIHKNS